MKKGNVAARQAYDPAEMEVHLRAVTSKLVS